MSETPAGENPAPGEENHLLPATPPTPRGCHRELSESKMALRNSHKDTCGRKSHFTRKYRNAQSASVS